jgi:hypothetical protein
MYQVWGVTGWGCRSWTWPSHCLCGCVWMCVYCMVGYSQRQVLVSPIIHPSFGPGPQAASSEKWQVDFNNGHVSVSARNNLDLASEGSSQTVYHHPEDVLGDALETSGGGAVTRPVSVWSSQCTLFLWTRSVPHFGGPKCITLCTHTSDAIDTRCCGACCQPRLSVAVP